MKRVLVLGSSGQVGAGLVLDLKKQGYEVFEMDIVVDKEHDLRIKNSILQQILPNVDFVYFLAFDIGGSKYLESYQNTFEFIQNNIEIMENTFRSLNNFDSKFLFASSQMADMNYSTYGLLKLIGEKYCYSMEKAKIVRFWNVYGIEKVEAKFHVITDFIRMAKEDGVIKMRTDGEESRDFLHISDCSRALIYIMENFNEIQKNIPLHIASFKNTKIIEVARIIANKFNAEIIKGAKQDLVQNNAMKEPDKSILEFWTPQINIENGVSMIIKDMEINE